MKNDEIIRMAREAGFSVGLDDPIIYAAHERFAALVAYEVGIAQYNNGYEAGQRNEREACAKVCDERADSYKYATDPWAHEHVSEANTCAAAIRARSEK